MLVLSKDKLNQIKQVHEENIERRNIIQEFVGDADKHKTGLDPVSELIQEMNMYDIDGSILSEIELKLKLALQQVISDPDIASHGYCIYFKMAPVQATIEKLMQRLPFLTKSSLQYAFVKTWGMNLGTSPMREDFFYIFLIFVSLYAMEKQKQRYAPEDNEIAKLCQLLILLHLWNSQRKKYIPTCQIDVMKYVISHKMNKSYHASKFENPLQLLKKTYIDPEGSSIPKLYFPRMFKDKKHSVEMIDAAWKRARQLFVSTKQTNIKTHKQTYTSGISPLYHEAAKDNLRISTAKAFDDENADMTDTYSTSSYDEYVSVISNNMAMTTHPNYPESIINRINEEVNNDPRRTGVIMKALHNLEYNDTVTEMLENMFAKLSGITKEEVCNPSFFDTVKKKIISSKHNKNVDRIKELGDKFCAEVYEKQLGLTEYTSWSSNYKTNSVNVIIYTLAYNIRTTICSNN